MAMSQAKELCLPLLHPWHIMLFHVALAQWVAPCYFLWESFSKYGVMTASINLQANSRRGLLTLNATILEEIGYGVQLKMLVHNWLCTVKLDQSFVKIKGTSSRRCVTSISARLPRD